MAEDDAVLGIDQARQIKPGFQRSGSGARRIFADHVQLAVREAIAHAGQRIGAKAQACQPTQFRAPVVWHIAVHRIQEQRIAVAAEHRFHFTGTHLRGLDIPLWGNAGVAHDQFAFIIHLQHRLATQPVDQLVSIRRFQ
ncbi:hypothetical protein D3C76_1389790 [compost metagenome]